MEKACQLIVKRGERGRGATRLIYARNRAADPRERERKREGEREREIFGRARRGGRRRACTHALKWNAFHLVGHFRGCHPLAPAPCNEIRELGRYRFTHHPGLRRSSIEFSYHPPSFYLSLSSFPRQILDGFSNRPSILLVPNY